MSEPLPTTAVNPPPTEQPKTEPVTIPTEVLERLQREATDAATRVAGEQTAKLLDERNKKLVQAITGEETKTPNQLLLEKFFEDPSSVLSVPYSRAKREGRDEAVTEIRGELKRERDNQAATHAVLSTRPDIYTNESAMKLIGSYWGQQDTELSPTEQLKNAVKEFDSLMEKSGAPETEKRVAAASSPSRTASSTSAETVGQPYAKREASSISTWQEKRVEEYRKKHGGQYPGTVRR